MAAKSICKVDECRNVVKARGWCNRHYENWRTSGSPIRAIERRVSPPRMCSIPDCGKPVHGYGWCSNHYDLWYRHGDPLSVGTKKGEVRRYFDEVVVPHEGDDCLLWPFARNRAGYGKMRRNGYTTAVHRLACEAINGPSPTEKHQAAHSCGNGHLGCVNPRHLSWKTSKENIADKIVHGTSQRGERASCSKLLEEQVLQIRSLRGEKSQSAIARQFGISQSTVKNIQLRKSWAWL